MSASPMPAQVCEVCETASASAVTMPSEALPGTVFVACSRCVEERAEPRRVLEDAIRQAGGLEPMLGSLRTQLQVWVPCARCGRPGECRRCDNAGGRYAPAAEHYSPLRVAHVVLRGTRRRRVRAG